MSNPLYKSVDGGIHWTEISHGLPKNYSTFASSIVVDPSSTVYAVFSIGGGIEKTPDGGQNWQRLANIWPTTTYLGRLLLDPFTKSTMYLGTNTDVYRSLYGGVTWDRINGDLKSPGGSVLAIDSSAPPQLYLGTEHGIWVFGRNEPSRIAPVEPPHPIPVKRQ